MSRRARTFIRVKNKSILIWSIQQQMFGLFYTWQYMTLAPINYQYKNNYINPQAVVGKKQIQNNSTKQFISYAFGGRIICGTERHIVVGEYYILLFAKISSYTHRLHAQTLVYFSRWYGGRSPSCSRSAVAMNSGRLIRLLSQFPFQFRRSL